MTPPIGVKVGEGVPGPSTQASGGVRVGKVWVVMATTGEWSDRTQWPIRAHLNEDDAKTDVATFTARCRAAEAQRPEFPTVDFDDPSWERLEAAYDRKMNRLTKSLRDCGGEMDASFFVYEVPFADTTDRSALPREKS